MLLFCQKIILLKKVYKIFCYGSFLVGVFSCFFKRLYSYLKEQGILSNAVGKHFMNDFPLCLE